MLENGIGNWKEVYCICPAVFGHFSPAPPPPPRKNRLCGTNLHGFVIIKVYNGSLRLIDWFNPPSEKLPHGDDFRVGPKSDRTPRDNAVLYSVRKQKSYPINRRSRRSRYQSAFGGRSKRLCNPPALCGANSSYRVRRRPVWKYSKDELFTKKTR